MVKDNCPQYRKMLRGGLISMWQGCYITYIKYITCKPTFLKDIQWQILVVDNCANDKCQKKSRQWRSDEASCRHLVNS